MKAMNEFESVLVIASLILAVCAAMDLPPAAPHAAAGRSGAAYSGYGVAQSIDLRKPDSIDTASNGAAGNPLPVAGLEADQGSTYAFQQARVTP